MGGSRGDIVRPVHRFDRSDCAQHRAAGSDGDLNPTSDQLLWIVDVYSLVLAGLLVATSSLSDRFGRSARCSPASFLFGVGSLLVLFANSPEFVIAIRAFLGVGGALIMPVTVSMIRSIFQDAKERVRRRGVVGHRSARHGHRAAHRRLSARALQLACGFPRQRAAHGDRAGRRHLVLPEVR